MNVTRTRNSIKLVIKAIPFSAEKHKSQKRRNSGLPYIVHPFTVMYLITKYIGNTVDLENLQCAALLHDTLEDCECSYSELEREFNAMVASLVLELSNDEELITKIGKHEYIKIKMLGMSKYAFILKLLDRYANILDSSTNTYIKNTIKLMNHLKENKPDLSQMCIEIIDDITEACEELL